MTEKEVIAKIQKLEQIGPEKDWILATKTQILGVDATATPFFVFSSQKLAFAGLLILLLLVGAFGFAQNSLPGDFLYPVKKMTERGQEAFVSEEERPAFKLECANKRLEELIEVAKTNKVKQLAPAIEEFEASVSEVAKELNEKGEPDPKIVEKAKQLGKKKERMERTYGVITETKELEETVTTWEQIEKAKEIVRNLIEDLEKSALTERQKVMLAQVKQDFENGDYSQALEKILISQ